MGRSPLSHGDPGGDTGNTSTSLEGPEKETRSLLTEPRDVGKRRRPSTSKENFKIFFYMKETCLKSFWV